LGFSKRANGTNKAFVFFLHFFVFWRRSTTVAERLKKNQDTALLYIFFSSDFLNTVAIGDICLFVLLVSFGTPTTRGKPDRSARFA
jgi:hypothetical protein